MNVRPAAALLLCILASPIVWGCGEPPVQPAACQLNAERLMTDVSIGQPLPADVALCMGLEDYDGDGNIDLLMGARQLDGMFRLSIYPGDGTASFGFPETVFANQGGPNACATGDVDGDGLMDIVTTGAPPSIQLWRNKGQFRFEEEPEAFPDLGLDEPFLFSVTLVDHDRDGDLDLVMGRTVQEPNPDPNFGCEVKGEDYVCRPFGESKSAPPLLFAQTDGRWSLQPDAFSGPWPGLSNTMVLWDANDDGFIDIFTSDDFSRNHLYLNQKGAGTFEEAADAYGLDGYNHGMGAALADFDGDGRMDLYSADLGPDRFYFSVDAEGRTDERAKVLGYASASAMTSSWAPLARDFDNDGSLDLVVVNSAVVVEEEELDKVAQGSFVKAPVRQHDFLYWSASQPQTNGPTQLDHRIALEPAVVYGASSAADLDGDSDLDVVIVAGYPAEARVLRNDTQGVGRALRVSLSAKGSNRGALGARVTVVRNDGSTLRQRVLGHGGGSLGGVPSRLHFGLCEEQSVQRVQIDWPDGSVQVVDGPIGTDELLEIDQI